MDLGSGYMPDDPRLVEKIVYDLKSQGVFDQFRKECFADVDTKPAYQNLRQRVEGSVAGFLKDQSWRPDMNKNQVREMLRKKISESGYLDTGVERIVDQVVNPKINTVFLPKVEEIVYSFLGVKKTAKGEAASSSTSDLLPNDLEAVSPEPEEQQIDAKMIKSEETTESDNQEKIDVETKAADVKEVKKEEELEEDEDSKMEEDESPPFEPLDEQIVVAHEENSADSHVSETSGLQSLESSLQSVDQKHPHIELESQTSRTSSDSRLSIVTSDDNSKMDSAVGGSTVEGGGDESQSKSAKKSELKDEKNRSHREKERDGRKSGSSKDSRSRHGSSRDKDKEATSRSRDRKESGSRDKDRERHRKDSRSGHRSDKEKEKTTSSSGSKHSSSSKHGKKESSSRDHKDKNRSSGHHKSKDSKEYSKDSKTSKDSSKDAKDSFKDTKNPSKDSKDAKDSSKDVKDSSKDSRDSKDPSKDAKDPSKGLSKDSSKKDSRHSKRSKKDEDNNTSSPGKKIKDDHYSSRDKKSDRRSTDRDSNDGSGKFGPSSTNQSDQSHQSPTQSESTNQNTGSNNHGKSDNSTEGNRDDSTTNTVDNAAVTSPVVAAPPVVEKVKVLKPKCASNIQEAIRLMKIRKQLARLEKENQLGLATVDTKNLPESSVIVLDDIQIPDVPKTNNTVVSKDSWEAVQQQLQAKVQKEQQFDENENVRYFEPVDLDKVEFLIFAKAYIERLENPDKTKTVSKGKQKDDVANNNSNKRKADVATVTADKKKPRRNNIVNSQRYSSDDLYKPRSSFTSRRRGARTSTTPAD